MLCEITKIDKHIEVFKPCGKRKLVKKVLGYLVGGEGGASVLMGSYKTFTQTNKYITVYIFILLI